jgi:nucleoside-diphosphate-sugar epimerase
VIPEIMEQVKKGNTLQLGNLDPKRDYIYIDDMASALDVIGRKSKAGYEVYNIGSGKEYSVRELVAVVESLVGRPLTISQDKQRMRSVERRHLLADINKIGQQLSWQPSMTINEGLYGTLKAYDIPTLS